MFYSNLNYKIFVSVLIIFYLLAPLSYATDDDGADAHSTENRTSQVIESLESQFLASIIFHPDKIDQKQISRASTFNSETFASDNIEKILKSAYKLIPQYIDERFKICGQLIISTQLQPMDESAWSGNLPDLRERTTVEFKDNGVLYQNGQILDSNEVGLWALSPKGKLCIYFRDKHPDITSAVHHSFLFKKNSIGQAVACSGHIEVREGKITGRITNDSGRYQPMDPQLLLSIKYLHSKNVLDPKITVVTVSSEEERNLSLEETLIIAYAMELNSLPPSSLQ